MTERWESFHEAGRKVGALWRRFEDGVLTTRIAFPLGDGEDYRAESVIAFEGDGVTWAAARYRQDPGGAAADVTRAAAGLGADTLPSFGEFRLVLDLLGSGADSVTFRRLDDADPAGEPRRAVLSRAGTETVGLAAGPRQCLRLDLVVDGERAGSHWADAGSVVKSDWLGAASYPEASAGEALAGLPPRIVGFLRDGFGD
ncbi:hypothetical protein KZX45_07250 [Georgenia sp. EYE_87]|uniref:hypothetical protein n=1 Tax=Georgenia sp. EYE_87 TaxID=2853448 RepID=UPI0020055565|nr:hypothetical protein [Georgenia sp. EYE_87]MCK6210338.1 hypothetical protein [Georgenia sp. EYE_87]